MLKQHLSQFPFIAILRGITPDEALEAGTILTSAGFKAIEVPMNSPDPLSSIEILSEAFGKSCSIGAGTIRTPEQADAIRKVGGTLGVMAHTDPALIAHCASIGLEACPGVGTVSEAFAALDAGACALKLFPAEMMPPAVVKAMRAVLPEETLLVPVGGMGPETWQPFQKVGARAYGTGSSLYKAGMSMETLEKNAAAFAASLTEGV